MKKKPMILISTYISVIICGALLIYKFTNPMDTKEKVLISADYPKYDTLENLVDTADTIVKGKIVESTCKDLNITQKNNSDDEYLNPRGDIDTSTSPYTVYTVKIEKSYKGEYAENDVVEVKQLGGTLGKVEYVLKDGMDAKLEKEHQYIFFLETYPDSPASLLNPWQASYEYDEKENQIKNRRGNENNIINFILKELEQLTMQ